MVGSLQIAFILGGDISTGVNQLSSWMMYKVIKRAGTDKTYCYRSDKLHVMLSLRTAGPMGFTESDMRTSVKFQNQSKGLNF